MNSHSSDFEFVDDCSTLSRDRSSSVRVVRIPAGLTKKRQLLATLASRLDFPKYFGGNWDAFEECLRDLSWLNGLTRLTLVHADVPCSANPETLASYLSILRDRVRDKAAQTRLQLRVLFPQIAWESVQAALES